jgi:flagellin
MIGSTLKLGSAAYTFVETGKGSGTGGIAAANEIAIDADANAGDIAAAVRAKITGAAATIGTQTYIVGGIGSAVTFTDNTAGAQAALDVSTVGMMSPTGGSITISEGATFNMAGVPKTEYILTFDPGMFTGMNTGSRPGGGLNLQIGDTADRYNIITVGVNDMSTRGLGIANLNIASYDAAKIALGTKSEQGDPGTIKGAINLVSTQRAALGALQNRLEHTINNLGVTTENVIAAESRIRDTDMAKEMMHYTKNNILVQAAQAMLAQANQVPQGVLQLLR